MTLDQVMQKINFYKYDYLLDKDRFMHYWLIVIPSFLFLFFFYAVFFSPAEKSNVLGLYVTTYYVYPFILSLVMLLYNVYDIIYGNSKNIIVDIYFDYDYFIIKRIDGTILKIKQFSYREQLVLKKNVSFYAIFIDVDSQEYSLIAQDGKHEELKKYLDMVIQNGKSNHA